jgi:hypothetical protein
MHRTLKKEATKKRHNKALQRTAIAVAELGRFPGVK